MNITNIVNPLIFGRKGIDDKTWKIKTTYVNSEMRSYIRVRCRNTFMFKTKKGIRRTNIFNVILFINSDGEFEFNRITINGAVTNQIDRTITVDYIYKLFRKSIEDKLQGKD